MILVIGLIVFEFIEHVIFPVPAIFLMQKLRRGGEIKSESQIDIYEELIKGNRYHLDGGDSLTPIDVGNLLAGCSPKMPCQP